MRATILSLAIVSILAFGLSGCKKKSTEEVGRPVKAMKLTQKKEGVTRIFPGRTKATNEINRAFRVPGQLLEFPVNVGQHIDKKGLIARLDPRDYEIRVRSLTNSLNEAKAKMKAMQAGAREEDIKALQAQLEGAESALSEAELQYNRYKNLYDDEAVPKAAYDKAKAAYDVARSKNEMLEQQLHKAKAGARAEDIEAMTAKIKSIKAQLDAATSALDDTYLRAPFDGYISVKYVDNFQDVAAGQPIVKLEDICKIEITVGVPEDMIIKRDYVVNVECKFEAFPERKFKAEIKEVSPAASQQTKTYPVTVIMNQPSDIQVLPGMTAEVYITANIPPESKVTGFLVPVTAVFSEEDHKRFVWVIDPNSFAVHRREVNVGEVTSEGIMATEGLKPGEWIVTAGVHFLEEGQKVRILK